MPKSDLEFSKTDLEFYGHDHPAVDVWRLYFEWPKNPLPMNGGRGNRWKHASTVRWVRELAVWRARAAHIPKMARVRVQLTWWVTTRGTRDADNLAALEKPIFDALATRHPNLPSARIVEDDSPEFMEKPRALIRHLDEAIPEDQLTGPGFVVTITRLQAIA